MPIFSFTLRLDDEGWEGMEDDLATEAKAIQSAREALQARIDLRPMFGGRAHRGTIGVGAGSIVANPERLVWLGEWEWSTERGWSWTPRD